MITEWTDFFPGCITDTCGLCGGRFELQHPPGPVPVGDDPGRGLPDRGLLLNRRHGQEGGVAVSDFYGRIAEAIETDDDETCALVESLMRADGTDLDALSREEFAAAAVDAVIEANAAARR